MKKYAGKSEDILSTIMDWQAVESKNIEYTTKDIPKAGNPFIKPLLQALRLEAEKRSLLLQLIFDSIQKEAVHLSPDELQYLSGHVNRHVEAGKKGLSLAKKAFERNELPIPRYLLSYLIADLKKENGLLKQFDDELKAASIPTSISSKTFGSSRAA